MKLLPHKKLFLRYFRPAALLRTIIFLNDFVLIMDDPEQNYVTDGVNSDNTTTPQTETRNPNRNRN